MKRILLVLLATTSIASAQPTPADDPTTRAKQLYTEGKRFYDIGEFAKAVEAWKQAYVLSTAPMLLFNIAQAYRLSGDCAQALRFYSNYERESSNLTNRAELDQARARCSSQPTGTQSPATGGTDPSPGGAPSDKLSPTTTGTTTTGSSSTPSGTTGGAPPTTSSTPLPAVTANPDRSRYRTAGLITGGTGVVFLGTSLVLALRARDRAGAVEAHRGEWTTAQDSLQASGQRAATWSMISGIAGALTVVAGGALYVYGSRETRPAIDVAIRPHAAEVTWSVSF